MKSHSTRPSARGLVAPVLAVLTAVLLSAAGAASAGDFSIEVGVYKGLDRAPVSGQGVTLHVVRGQEEMPGATRATGRDGKAKFDKLPDAGGLEFYVSTEYKGAVYTEGPLHAGPDGVWRQDLTVYDVGKDLDKVEVSNHHIVVERANDGLHVNEIMIIENSAPTAYLGSGMSMADQAGIRLGLPASIKDFQPGMGADPGTMVAQGRELTSLRPIPPGQRPVSFTYHIPLSGRMDLSHRFYFPTRTFVIMIDDPKLKIESKALHYSGSRDQGGKKYEVYTGENLPVGSEVPIRVHGASFWSNPAIYPWLAIPFLVAGILVFARRMAGNSPKPFAGPVASPMAGSSAGPAPAPRGDAGGSPGAASSSSNGDDLAATYAFLIAALDHGRETGEVSPESHALVRGNLKRRLETIVTDAPARRAGGAGGSRRD